MNQKCMPPIDFVIIQEFLKLNCKWNYRIDIWKSLKNENNFITSIEWLGARIRILK